LGRPIVFVDVNLVPMDEEKVFHHKTVVVNSGKVEQIGETSEIEVPRNATEVNGRGKYLMPGLADMHTHVWGEASLLLFVANGVTTVRNMWGASRQLAWRERIEKGLMIGPTIFTAGPLLDGIPPIWNTSGVIGTKGEAVEEVEREVKLGYDFVKVYNRLSKEAYGAIVSTAKRLRIPVAGHVPYAVGLEGVLKAGQKSIEHLEGYIYAIQANESPVRGKFDPPSKRSAIDYVDDGKIRHIIAATREAGVWNCVTLVVMQKFVPPEAAEALLKDVRMSFVPPDVLASWNPSADFRMKDRTALDYERERKADAMRSRLVRDLHRVGAHILLGTDTPNPFVIPGFSIHEELRNLVSAGLTPYEAIRAGTRSAAEFLGVSDEFGTVEVGKRADLILLKDNPLEDVGNVSKILGVVVRGRWYPRPTLQRILHELVLSYTVNEKQLGRFFHPFRSAGRNQIHYGFLVKSSGVLLGKERVVRGMLSRGAVVISSQVVMNAPPRMENSSTRLEVDEKGIPISLSFDCETSEGRTTVRMKATQGKIKISGNTPRRTSFHFERNEPEDVLLGTPSVASFISVLPRLHSLNVGRTRRFKMLRLETEPELGFVESSLEFERKPDKEDRGKEATCALLKAYGMKDTRRNGSYSGNVTLDCEGRLLLFERVEQMGLRTFELA
jgi:imidazolonepropionase-like amidohydrolase